MIKSALSQPTATATWARMFIRTPFFKSQQLQGAESLFRFFEFKEIHVIDKDPWQAMRQFAEGKRPAVSQLVRDCE
jgi:hypothetical protein